jgi:hypothetical protein
VSERLDLVQGTPHLPVRADPATFGLAWPSEDLVVVLTEHVDKDGCRVGRYERFFAAFAFRVLCPFFAAFERFMVAFVILAADCFE